MHAWAILAIGASLLFAGCLETGQPSAMTTATAMPSAAEPTADAATGSITGTVLDDENRPIAKAAVAIPELELESIVDDEGKFTFNNLEPRTYQLFVGRAGFEANKKMVEVTPGAVSEVAFVLKPLKILLEWVDVQIKSQSATSGNYLAPAPNDVQKWTSTWVLKDDPRELRDLVVEIHWKPTTALGDGIRVWSAIKAFDSGKDLCVGAGHAPYKCRVAPEKLTQDWECPEFKDCRAGYAIRPGGSSATNSLVGLWPQESFTLYFSHFFRMGADDDYTAVPA